MARRAAEPEELIDEQCPDAGGIVRKDRSQKGRAFGNISRLICWCSAVIERRTVTVALNRERKQLTHDSISLA